MMWTIYIENPKGSRRKLLEVINDCNKVVRYKAHIQNQLLFYIKAMNNWIFKLKTTLHLH